MAELIPFLATCDTEPHDNYYNYQYSVVVMASSQSEALGYALDSAKETTAMNWEIKQIDPERAGVHVMD